MSDMRCDISLTVNGETVHETVDARQTLVDFLREQLVLTGSHVGCEHGVCGACTVRVNGLIVRGCLMLAAQCEGAKVETIEGVSDSGEIADLQDGVREAQRPAMRLLHARHAADRAGTAGNRPRAEPRENPRAYFRQLLPLHRLPRHRRRASSAVAKARAGEGQSRMKIVDDSPPVLTALDRPNSYIGRSVPRPNMSRLMQGRAQYVSDVVLPRMAHVAFVRSPHAHAKIKSIDADAAKKAPGVIAVVTGAELAKVITPWVGVLTHLKGIKSAPQHAIAVDRACWAGEAVCAVVARTPRRSRRRLRAGSGRLRGARGRHRSGDRARSEDAGDPSRARRQSHLRARACRGRSRQGLRRGRRGGRDHLRVRPPHRRLQRGRAPSSPTGIPASSA